MSNFDEQDDVSSLNRKDTANKLPLGWVIFFLALIVWGIYYIYAYMPSISGWTQIGTYDNENPKMEPMKPEK